MSWVALFLVVGAVVFSNITYAGKAPGGSLFLSDSNLGGPLEASLESFGVIQGTLGVPGDETDQTGPFTGETNVVTAVNAPEGYVAEGTALIVRDYTVQEGDTLESIAQKFSISKDTIGVENNLEDLDTVQVGSTLRILPVDGIRKELEEEQTLAALAEKYQVSEQDIREFNGLGDGEIAYGTDLIIPDAVVPNDEKPFYEPPVRVASTRTSTARVTPQELPQLSGYFGYPTTGRNYGVLHSSNGVDIANSCGTPIYASAGGTVTTSQDGWNGGYGSYIKITHPNGVVTLYGHLSQRISQVGSGVAKGELIGYMGTTGRSTGCHLHFEVRGAANPLAR